jgi:serine/threonine protein kinase/tetratricopeptide (TPR) repeat protein
MALDTGKRFGRYEIRSLLGTGGMGEVYLAQDIRLERTVALKFLPAEVADNQQRIHRFAQEARAASALSHPNVAHIYEIEEAEGHHFIVMEYVNGRTLRQYMASEGMSVEKALDVAAQVAAGLSAAHAAGIVHRDIKPENIMLRPDGYVKILDFGLAKLTEQREINSEASTMINTDPGLVIGTINYMSPEQVRGLTIDARTDIWSLGVVLYEMLAGVMPFKGATTGDRIVSVLEREAEPLAQYFEKAPNELERIINRALMKDVDARYQTAGEIEADLKRLKQQLEFELERNLTRSSTIAISAPSVAVPQNSARVARESSGEQRKQVTIFYADLSGFAALAAEWDAEELSDLMNALWERIDEVIVEHGGISNKRMGDVLMALWGALAAHEDDPEQAIRAALAIQAEAGEFAVKRLRARTTDTSFKPGRETESVSHLLMRIGINTGQVLLSNMGAKDEFTAVGLAVNLTSRLQQSAPVGGILISHDTYHHVRGVFDVQELELMTVEGKAEPVQVYRVLRAKPRAFRLGTRGVEGIETRMIGRQAELDRLMDAMQTVIEDQELQVVTVIGDAGLGKSRLLYEFMNEVELSPQQVRVFNGRASEAMRGLPYSLVRNVLSFRFEIQDSDSPAVAQDKLEQGILASSGMGEQALMHAHFLGHLIGFDFSSSPHLSGILNDAKQIRDRAFHYAAQFLAAVARNVPVILCVEDLHWADDGSLEFVDYLARTCGSVQMLMLCLARPALLERRPVWGEGQTAHTRLTLQPLSKRESRRLVEEILRQAHTIPHALRELVVSAAEGNPFFVEELIKMLIDRKVILPGPDRWQVDATELLEVRVPATLTGVLQARLDGLSPWEKTVLQRASVIGREFWDVVIERFDTEPARSWAEAETRSALEALRRKELIYQREVSSFAGAREYTFKHALLRDVTYESVLKRERRKYHLLAAEWLVEKSGERVHEYAGIIAEHYERAQESERAAKWYGRAGDQARITCSPETAIGYYRKAIGILPFETDPGTHQDLTRDAQLTEWYEGLGEVLWMQARFIEAVEAYTSMRMVAKANGDAVAEARAWNGLAIVQGNQGDNRGMLESAGRAVALARGSGPSAIARTELASALNRQGWAYYRLGDAGAVKALSEQALALSTELGEAALREQARSLQSLGLAHQMLGHFEQAYHYIERALVLFRKLSDRRLVANMLNSLGETARLRGDYGLAFERYQEAHAIAREIGNRAEQMAYLGNLGAARVGLGKYEAAETDLRQVIEMAGTAGYFGLSENYRFLAEALLGQGKVDEALEMALVALSLGQGAGGQEHIGGAWRALGLVASRSLEAIKVNGQTYDAGQCFERSLSVFTEIGMEAERARTLREWANYERTHGDELRGREMWREALEIFTHLGMKLEIERMEKEKTEENGRTPDG